MWKKGPHRQPSNASSKQSSSAPETASQPEIEYNVVYQQLVANDDDIVGQLAYCLYKQSKQQYLQEFQRLNQRRPTDGELRNHVACAELPALKMYREKATRVVSELLAQAAQEKQEELEAHFKDRLWKFIGRHQHDSLVERGWHTAKGLAFGGAGGVIGNFFTTVAVLFILFFAASSDERDEFSRSAKERLVSGLAQVMGVGVSINEPAVTTTDPSLPTPTGSR
jgi:hypothetical protein